MQLRQQDEAEAGGLKTSEQILEASDQAKLANRQSMVADFRDNIHKMLRHVQGGQKSKKLEFL